VFLDTPGIHRADTALNKRLMDAVRPRWRNATCCWLLADARAPIGKDDRQALDLARKCHAPVVLVLNKIDW